MVHLTTSQNTVTKQDVLGYIDVCIHMAFILKRRVLKHSMNSF